MKILHVHDVACVASNLVAGLHELGAEAFLYEVKKYSNPATPKWLRNVINFCYKIIEIFRFRRYLNSIEFDVVHIHFGSFSYLALINNISFYLHIHGTDIREYVKLPLLGWIIKLGLRRAVRVFYSTPDLKTLIEPYRSDAIFFPNPIDTEKFRPKDNRPQDKPFDVFVISKIDKYKGFQRIIDTLQLALEENPQLRVLILGFGNAVTESIEQFISQNKNNPNFEVSGPIWHDEMPCVINRSKVILGQLGTGILSCSELEAMACGKPVVCNFSFDAMYPSPPPIIFAENAMEAKEKISVLVMDGVYRKEVGAQARQWIVNYYDKKAVAKRVFEFYVNNLEGSTHI